MKGACFLSSAAVVFWEMQSEAWYGVGESAWHHKLSGHEFEQTLEDSEGQRSLVTDSP